MVKQLNNQYRVNFWEHFLKTTYIPQNQKEP